MKQNGNQTGDNFLSQAFADIEGNIIEAGNDRYFGAGRQFGPAVFTRDIALSGLLALNSCYPGIMMGSLKYTRRARRDTLFRASEEYIVKEIEAPWEEGGKNAFHCGPVTRRSDDVVWIWCAADLIGRMGNRENDLRWLYEEGRWFFDNLYAPFFDESDGLYRGQALFIDVHFPHMKSNGYPLEWSVGDGVLIKALSTNALYAKAMEIMAHVADKLGLPGESRTWRRRGAELRSALRRELRDEEGFLSFYKDRTGRLAGRLEALGTALAVLFDIYEPHEARLVLDRYPREAWGVPLFSSFYDLADKGPDGMKVIHGGVYHNHSSWGFVDTFYFRALEKVTGEDFSRENRRILEGYCLPGDGFKEVFNFESREPFGSNHQLWTACAYLDARRREGLLLNDQEKEKNMKDMNCTSKHRPNIIWVFGDQHRGQALGINGDTNARTPHIDNLARLGVNFPRALSGFPLCCPARDSLMTSRYPHKCVPGHEYRMPEDQKTIAHAFNKAGYDTAYFGKWHLDGYREHNMREMDCRTEYNKGRAMTHTVPPERRGGFNLWYGYDNNNSPWDTEIHGGRGDETERFRLKGYETDALTDMLIDYMEEQRDEPFFAVLSVQPPHNPYVAPAENGAHFTPGCMELRRNVPDIPEIADQARRDLAGYYGQIHNLDTNLGRIRETLKELAIDEDTHIIFFSDHGDMHGSHGHFKKTSPYQESISIPFIIGGEKARYNGRLNGMSDALVNHVDVAPTTLGLCDIPVPAWMEGTDYASHRLKGVKADDEPDSAYLQLVVPTGHGDSIDRAYRGLVTKDGYKYVCFEKTPWLLFDLNTDPYEMVNLAHNTKYRSLRKRLNDRLQRWIDETDDEFTLPEV